MAILTDKDNATLEAMVDRSSVREVIEALASVCYAKSDHVLTNWQDKGLAKSWEQTATRLDKFAATLPR